MLTARKLRCVVYFDQLLGAVHLLCTPNTGKNLLFPCFLHVSNSNGLFKTFCCKSVKNCSHDEAMHPLF